MGTRETGMGICAKSCIDRDDLELKSQCNVQLLRIILYTKNRNTCRAVVALCFIISC